MAKAKGTEKFKKRGVEATIIGKFIKQKKAIVKYNKTEVLNLDMNFLHEGYPKLKLKTKKPTYPVIKKNKLKKYSLINKLHKILSSSNIVTKEFDCIDFYDVPEFQGKFEQMETERSYTGNLGGVIDGSDISCYYSHRMKTIDPDQIVFTGDDNIDKGDFDHFCQGRKSINLNDYTKKFLHFENNLFGHYWYMIYPGNPIERNILKDKINTCFRYKSKFYELSKKVKEKIGDYNSVHVRRNDFKVCHAERLVPSDLLLDKLYSFFEPSKPLYIATDEKDLSFFDPVREKYDIYFYI